MTTFKYQDKIITTPNLEKKLKRMKLQLSDIEIIEAPEKIEIQEEQEEIKEIEQVIIRSTQDDIKRVCYVIKETRPPIKELLKNQIWNPETKTGLYPELFIETMYYDE